MDSMLKKFLDDLQTQVTQIQKTTISVSDYCEFFGKIFDRDKNRIIALENALREILWATKTHDPEGTLRYLTAALELAERVLVDGRKP